MAKVVAGRTPSNLVGGHVVNVNDVQQRVPNTKTYPSDPGHKSEFPNSQGRAARLYSIFREASGKYVATGTGLPRLLASCAISSTWDVKRHMPSTSSTELHAKRLYQEVEFRRWTDVSLKEPWRGAPQDVPQAHPWKMGLVQRWPRRYIKSHLALGMTGNYSPNPCCLRAIFRSC